MEAELQLTIRLAARVQNVNRSEGFLGTAAFIEEHLLSGAMALLGVVTLKLGVRVPPSPQAPDKSPLRFPGSGDFFCHPALTWPPSLWP